MADDYPPHQPTARQMTAAKRQLAAELATYRTLTTTELHRRLGPLLQKQAWWRKHGCPTAVDYVRMEGLTDELSRRRRQRKY